MSTGEPGLVEEDIAEELAAGQRQISIAEFFEKNKHMLGFDSGARALVTAVKEAVDNALDATEEAGILPDIYVEIVDNDDFYTLIVEDNGPGITPEQVPKVFGKMLYGSRFHTREQARGQQGIGISAAVLYSQLTSGNPARITSKIDSNDDADYVELIIDTDENEPEIRTQESTTWERPHGTRIELDLEANMRARQQLQDYIKHTAVVNPHARIELHEPKGSFKAERGTDQLPAETSEIRPHPHGVELGTLLKMLSATSSHSVSGFLQNEFTRVGAKTSESIIEAFKDRHYGREMTWRVPGLSDEGDVAKAVREAVANKGARPTDEFAKAIASGVDSFERIAHFQLVEVVNEAAEKTEAEFPDRRFGQTVRENAVMAAWEAITSTSTDDLYPLVNRATSNKKNDETVRGLVERLGEKYGSLAASHRATRDTIEDFVDRSADQLQEYEDATVGETARENITEALWAAMRRVPDAPPKVKTISGDRDMAQRLLEAMQESDILAPPTDCLSPITAELIEAGLKKEFDADFFAAATREAEVHGGDPFIAEAGIAYGGDIEDDGRVNVMRFANRVPLVYQRGACATTDVIKDIGWRNYGLSQSNGSLPEGPAVIMVHVASTNVPFTSESKDAIANIPAIEDEIELAIREAARDLKSYLNKRRSLQKRREKEDVIATILPQMAKKLAEVTDRPEPNYGDSLARIMNNVIVSRSVEDGVVTISIENNMGQNADLELTDILPAEPTAVSDGASVLDMDGEYFLKWSGTLEPDASHELQYEISGDVEFDIDVSGVEAEKLTVTA